MQLLLTTAVAAVLSDTVSGRDDVSTAAVGIMHDVAIDDTLQQP